VELEEKLTSEKEHAETVLRSLRQEHERVKVGYEKQIKDLQAQLDQDGATGHGDRGPRPVLGPGREQDRSKKRIAELEKELDRVRKFYSKRMKEVEKRGENQIRSLKRGSTRIQEPEAQAPVKPSGGLPQGAPDGEEAPTETSREVADLRSKLEAVQQLLHERDVTLNVRETELAEAQKVRNEAACLCLHCGSRGRPQSG
jgi:hypothetical protein